MKFETKVHEGKFLKRYKRFFADIEWNNQTVTAHTPNTGSMKSCNTAGSACRFSESNNPERKLKFTLEMIQSPETNAWVGVNTSIPNAIVKEFVQQAMEKPSSQFKQWQGFKTLKPEFKISAETRFDFALLNDEKSPKHFIEVKNVTLREVKDGQAQAQFPDAVTERGQKHLRELIALKKQGHTCEIIFVIQRNDCDVFAPADLIDPEYGKLLREAKQEGVLITPLLAELSMDGVKLDGKLLKLQL